MFLYVSSNFVSSYYLRSIYGLNTNTDVALIHAKEEYVRIQRTLTHNTTNTVEFTHSGVSKFRNHFRAQLDQRQRLTHMSYPRTFFGRLPQPLLGNPHFCFVFEWVWLQPRHRSLDLGRASSAGRRARSRSRLVSFLGRGAGGRSLVIGLMGGWARRGVVGGAGAAGRCSERRQGARRPRRAAVRRLLPRPQLQREHGCRALR